MADSTERIRYEVEFDSEHAVTKANAFDKAVEHIARSTKNAQQPMQQFGNMVKFVAGELNLTDEQFKHLQSSVQNALDPTKQLVSQMTELARATANFKDTGEIKHPFGALASEKIDAMIKRTAQESKQFSADLKKDLQDRMRAEQQEAAEAARTADAMRQIREASGGKLSEKGVAQLSEHLKKSADPAATLRDILREVNSNLYGSVTYAERVDNAFAQQAKTAKGTARAASDSFKELGKHKERVAKTPVVTRSEVAQVSKFRKIIDGMTGSLRIIGGGFKDLGGNIKHTTVAANALHTAFKGLSGIAIGRALAQGAKSAIDFYETLNLFEVAMKSSIAEGKKFIGQISEWYGLDPKNLMQYTGMFYEMAYAVGAPDDAARKLSTSMTSLSVDLASLFNVPVEKVTENMISGMRGMSRAVVKYGLDLRASTVEAYANKHGITQQYETMNEASREILRYLVAVEQASDATGKYIKTTGETITTTDAFGRTFTRLKDPLNDFARTIEQPANQLRVFQEQLAQLGRAIGTFLIAPLERALPVINGFVMALRIIIETIAALFGLTSRKDSPLEHIGDSADKAAGSVGGIGSAADSAKKKVKALLAPFDELNILQENQSKAGGAGGGGVGEFDAIDPTLLKLLDEAQYKLGAIRMKALDTRDAILAFFGIMPSGDSWVYAPDIFEANLIEKFPEWQQTIHSLFDLDFYSLANNFKWTMNTILEILKETIQLMIDDFTSFFGITDEKMSEWLDTLVVRFADFNIWLEDHASTIAHVLSKLLELVIMYKVLNGIITMLSPLLTIFGTIFTGLGIGLDIFGSVLSTVNSIFEIMFLKVETLIGIFSGPLTSVLAGITTMFAVVLVGGFIKWLTTTETGSSIMKSIFESVGKIFKNVGDIILGIFKAIGNAIDFCATHFQDLYTAVAGLVDGILKLFVGITDFLAGIFTGDMERATKGLKEIWYSFTDVLYYAVASVANMVIRAINLMIEKIINGVIGVVNDILRGISGLLSFIGVHIDIQIPDVPTLDLIPIEAPQHEFARGGVVTGPTRALIGEAGRSEAVIPLDNSPQMLELIDKIADKVNQAGETVVKVIIGDREWDAFTYQSAQRGRKLVGAQPIEEGRA